jgi:acetyl esterase/lipase
MTEKPTETPGAINFEARSIPLPSTISEQARAYMTMMGAPRPLPSYPSPQDTEAWRKYIAGQAEMMKQMMAARATAPSDGTETIRLGEFNVYTAKPAKLAANRQNHAYLDIHGGALVFGGGEACKMMAASSAERWGAELYSVDYRMPPDHPYPTAVDDCLAAYKYLLKQYPAQNIVVGGGSAGGNLAAATILKARDEGLPLPAGVVLLTPMTDLTEAGDSFETMRDLDVILRRRLFECGALYAGGKDLKTPYISAIFADFSKGFPRTFLQSGTRDLFLSNTVLLHRAMRRAGIEAELHIWEAMPHGGFGGASPEDRDMTEEARRFLNKCWQSI